MAERQQTFFECCKTQAMLFTTKKKDSTLKSQNEDLELKIRDDELQVVQKMKHLGVQIDCSLDWTEQINAVSTKASRALGFLKHAKSYIPRESLKALYTGVVEHHFRYCFSFWAVQAQLKLISSRNVLQES